MKGSRADQKSAEHDRLVAQLVKTRQEAGISQRELARQLGWHNASVLRMERGERAVEVVEFIRICRILGQDPSAILSLIDKESHK